MSKATEYPKQIQEKTSKLSRHQLWNWMTVLPHPARMRSKSKGTNQTTLAIKTYPSQTLRREKRLCFSPSRFGKKRSPTQATSSSFPTECHRKNSKESTKYKQHNWLRVTLLSKRINRIKRTKIKWSQAWKSDGKKAVSQAIGRSTFYLRRKTDVTWYSLCSFLSWRWFPPFSTWACSQTLESNGTIIKVCRYRWRSLRAASCLKWSFSSSGRWHRTASRQSSKT